MFDRDKWQEIFGALRKNKLRTILTAFGVFWGIFMLIVMLGSGNGLQNGVTAGMEGFATNSMFIWTSRTTLPYKGFPRGRRFWFKNDDTKALVDNIPEIKLIAPRIQGWSGEGTNNTIRGIKTGAFTIQGDYPQYNLIDPVTITEGRFINNIDIEQKRKVAIIGTRVYEVLFEPGEDPIGEVIMLQGVYFTVVGTFTPNNDRNMGPDREEMIVVPLTTLQKTYNYGDIVGYYAITTYDNYQVADIEERVRTILAQRHTVSPDDKLAFGSFNLQEKFASMMGLFSGIRILIWIVGTGTLIAGIIGVSNIMLVIIRERTVEIGIRRAIGATPRDIIDQVITEAVFLTTFAGILGLSFGVLVLSFVSKFLEDSPDPGVFREPEVSLKIALLSLLILIISGALSGIIPAKRAISIKPIEALRKTK